MRSSHLASTTVILFFLDYQHILCNIFKTLPFILITPQKRLISLQFCSNSTGYPCHPAVLTKFFYLPLNHSMVLLRPIFLNYSLLIFPPQTLRSSGHELFCKLSFCKSSMGGKSFSVLAPKLWYSLTLALRTTTTLHEFKSKLKSHLFKEYY